MRAIDCKKAGLGTPAKQVCGCGNKKIPTAELCLDCHCARLRDRSGLVSDRQLEAVSAFAKTGSFKQASQLMGVSEKDSYYLCDQARKKLHIKTLYHLVAWAFMKGVVGTEHMSQ